MLFTTPSAEPALAAVIPVPVLAMLLPLLEQAFPVPQDLMSAGQLREVMAHMLHSYRPESAAEATLAALIIMTKGQAAGC